MTNQSKPWTRWWWHGSAVTSRDLSAEMEKYARRGPRAGSRSRPSTACAAARTGSSTSSRPSGWTCSSTRCARPSRLGLRRRHGHRHRLALRRARGSRTTTACKNLVLEDLRAERRRAPRRARADGAEADRARDRPRASTSTTCASPIGENAEPARLALDQVRFEKPLPLLALWPTRTRRRDGRPHRARRRRTATLDWVAPAGRWTLYARLPGLARQDGRARRPRRRGQRHRPLLGRGAAATISRSSTTLRRPRHFAACAPSSTTPTKSTTPRGSRTGRRSSSTSSARAAATTCATTCPPSSATTARRRTRARAARLPRDDLRPAARRVHRALARVGAQARRHHPQPVARLAGEHPRPLRRERHPRNRGHRHRPHPVRLRRPPTSPASGSPRPRP